MLYKVHKFKEEAMIIRKEIKRLIITQFNDR